MLGQTIDIIDYAWPNNRYNRSTKNKPILSLNPEATTKSMVVFILWTSLPRAKMSPGLDLSLLRWACSMRTLDAGKAAPSDFGLDRTRSLRARLTSSWAWSLLPSPRISLSGIVRQRFYLISTPGWQGPKEAHCNMSMIPEALVTSFLLK